MKKKDEKKDSARSVPFFARYLVGQEEAAKSTDSKGRTLKYPSDWDEDDWRR